MMETRRTSLASALFALLTCVAMQGYAQPRAAECFFTADFEGDDPLQGWDPGATVERQDENGNGLGEFVPAWIVGNADDANVAGYFPVPDAPVGGRFAMANDAAPPCNCAMGEVGLTTPSLDFTDRTGVGMECRVFNDGQFGGGSAFLESSVGGGPWNLIENIPAINGDWQQLSFDLSSLDGLPDVRLRFRWSDGDTWASGFAVDDICIRERLTYDVSMIAATIGDVTVSAFDGSTRTLSYRELPLEQASFLSVSVLLRNRGVDPVPVTGVDVNVIQNGVSQIVAGQFPIGTLQPGRDTTIVIALNWTPSEVGSVELDCSINSSTPDNDPSDNSMTAQLRVTGPGWDGGYSAMSCDAGNATGSVGSTDQYIVSNRMEITSSNSTAAGISALLAPGTEVGSVIRAILMDANFALIDTSRRYTLTQEDIDGLWNGVPIYLALNAPPSLSVGDVFVGIQHITTSTDLRMNVAVGGEAAFGRSALQEGLGFSLSFLASTPMVRLHLSEVAVGLAELTSSYTQFSAYPNPANSELHLAFDLDRSSAVNIELFDPSGRMVRTNFQGRLSVGPHLLTIPVSDLSTGLYLIKCTVNGVTSAIRVQVIH